MIPTTFNYRQSAQLHHRPLVFVAIITKRTSYIYGMLTPLPAVVGDFAGISQYDGTRDAGDGGRFGAGSVAEADARVLSFGTLRDTLAPQLDNLIASLRQTELSSYSVSLDNTDGYFSNILGGLRDEQFLGQTLEVWQTFQGLAEADRITLFSGEITQVTLSNRKLRLTAQALTTVYPAPPSGEGIDVLALEDDGLGIMAADTFTFADLETTFFTTDSWVFRANVLKDDLAEAGALLHIINDLYSYTVLQIGVDASNYVYCTVGSNVETTGGTTTYTDTYALTAGDIANPLYIKVWMDSAANLITFTVNGSSRSQAAATFYDRTGNTDTNTFRLGDAWDGKVLNAFWNVSHQWCNNTGENTLDPVPDVISGLDLPRVNGTWSVWP